MERGNGRTRRIKIISMGAAESGKVGAGRAPHRGADEVRSRIAAAQICY